MSRRILITGGASGLGAALAAAFSARGDRVLVTDIGAEAPAQLPAGASYLKLDVTSQEDWDAARDHVAAEFGGLDILVNNAGVAAGGRIEYLDLEEWRWITEINLFGVVRGCRTFTPMFKEQGSGHLVNTASMAGLVHPPAMSSYNAVKAAVVAVSETLRFELHPFGIDVSVICPSYFRTNLASSLRGTDPLMDGTAKKLINKSKIGAEEIAAIVVRGVDKRQPLILTDKPGRRAYWAKRLLRPLYDRQMLDFGTKLRRGAEQAARATSGAGRPAPGAGTEKNHTKEAP
ncbi:SDR family NAD(P)-dependent oxidoreductase [Streptomyces sp. NA04227]|uniref:SDR family NAD(P)-dependent oxidoreductase n=1 Tax=Streptomyces sp. NA04227 TaxID=2742136 RepID=UPI001591C5A6|nr:SDR family NAD(P)-dependent oxidoreductase [Streptomyces sp. NA04227]QKW06165.1 SDR family NAD(P)-dependent oxidoreductase [Streptomyces sp. NA04227]